MHDDQYRASASLEQDQLLSPTGNSDVRIVALSSTLRDWSDEFNNRHHAEHVNRIQPNWNFRGHQYYA